MAKKHRGTCACGAVTFEFDSDPDFIAVCHCLDCKKASGGEAATWFGVPEDDFTLLSGNPRRPGPSPIRASRSTATSAPNAPHAFIPATWAASPARCSCNWGA